MLSRHGTFYSMRVLMRVQAPKGRAMKERVQGLTSTKRYRSSGLNPCCVNNMRAQQG